MNFVNLPVPAGNGVGAAVEVGSAMAALKTIMATGTLKGSVTIEVSTDAAGLRWGPLKTFTTFPEQETLKVVATFMRVRVSGFVSGVAEVSVGGEPGQILVNPLPIVIGTGVGAPVSMRDDEFVKTFVVAGTFTGSLNVEISQDGTDWAPLATYTQPTTDEDVEVVCTWMRVRSANVKGTPFIDCATSLPNSETSTTTSLPLNVDLYVNSVTGDDSNPGTLALPLLTWDGALSTVPPQYTGYCRVHFAAGTYPVPDLPGSPNPGRRDYLPVPRGPHGSPVAFIGTFTSFPGAPGTRTITASADGWHITDGTLALLPGNVKGASVLFTSGTNSGWRVMVKGNDATTLELELSMPFPIAPGDTFELQQPGTTLVGPGVSAWSINGNGYGETSGSCTFTAFTFSPGSGPGLKFVNCVIGSAGSIAFMPSPFAAPLVLDNSIITSNIGSIDPGLVPVGLPSNNPGAWNAAGFAFFNGQLSLINGSEMRGTLVFAMPSGGFFFVGNLVSVDSNSLIEGTAMESIFTSMVALNGGRIRTLSGGFAGPFSRCIGAADFFGFVGFAPPVSTQKFGMLDLNQLQIGNAGTLYLNGVQVADMADAVIGNVAPLAATASFPVLTPPFQYGIAVTNMSKALRSGTPPTLTGGLNDTIVGTTPTPYAGLPFTDGVTLCRFQ